MLIHRLRNLIYGISCSIFSSLEFNFCLLKLPLPRYGLNRSFAGFKTSFTPFAPLFLALWRLFWVDWRYCCQDAGENIHSPALKPFYGISSSIFSNMEVILCRLRVLLPRYGRNRSFSSFETNFTAFAILFVALEVILSPSKVLLP